MAITGTLESSQATGLGRQLRLYALIQLGSVAQGHGTRTLRSMCRSVQYIRASSSRYSLALPGSQ